MRRICYNVKLRKQLYYSTSWKGTDGLVRGLTRESLTKRPFSGMHEVRRIKKGEKRRPQGPVTFVLPDPREQGKRVVLPEPARATALDGCRWGARWAAGPTYGKTHLRRDREWRTDTQTPLSCWCHRGTEKTLIKQRGRQARAILGRRASIQDTGQRMDKAGLNRMDNG